MLQANMLDDRSLTATSLPAIETDVFEETLSFDPATGNFTFGVEALDSAGLFRIRLTAAQKIIINAGTGITFTPTTRTGSVVTPATPFKPLPFNNSGSFNASPPFNVVSPTRMEIDVTTLPSEGGFLGFVLVVQFTSGSTSVRRIQTPPFLVTPDQPFPSLQISLQYSRDTGVFKFTSNELLGIGSMTLEKGFAFLRLHDGNSTPPSTIQVTLEQQEEEGIIFAHQNPAVFNSDSGADVTRNSDTELTITRPFISGTGFNVNFGVHLTAQNCTVYSPDPIIIDKTIGSNPPEPPGL
jgi:hypothetical protein